MTFRFNTDDFAERDRFAAFCEGMCRSHLRLDISQIGSGPFSGTIEARIAGDVSICEVTTSSADYFRNRQLVRDGKDSLFAVLPRAGRIFTTQGSSMAEVDVGNLVICDSTELGGLKVASDAHYLAIEIPRRRLESSLPRLRRFAGLQRKGHLAVTLLSGYLEGTLGKDLSGDANAAQLFGDQLIDLVAFALGSRDERHEGDKQGGIRAARIQAVLEQIETRLTDPSLNAASVAATLGVTPRYVHRLLEESNSTFSQYLLERRLDLVEAWLRDPKYAELRIADIAYGAGFTDLSHFNRSFRKRFSSTPTDLRVSARKTERD